MFSRQRLRILSAASATVTFLFTLLLSFLGTTPASAFVGTLENGNMAYAQGSGFDKGEACNYLPGITSANYDAWHFVLTTRGAVFQQSPTDPTVAINLNFVFMRQDGSLFVLKSGAWVQTGKGAYVYTLTNDRIRMVQTGSVANINVIDSGMRLSHTCPGVGGSTPVVSPSPTPTATASPTPTATATRTPSPTPTTTSSPSPTSSTSRTPTPTASPSTSSSRTPTPTPTPSASVSPTSSPSASPTPSASSRPSNSSSPRPSARASAIQPHSTRSPSPSGSPFPRNPLPTPTTSIQPINTPTPTPSTSRTPTASPTPSPSPAPTTSPSATPTPTPSQSYPPAVIPTPPPVEDPKNVVYVEPEKPKVIDPQVFPEPPASPVVITKEPEHGTITPNDNGTFTYTPEPPTSQTPTVDVVEFKYTNLAGAAVVVRKEFVLTQKGDVPKIIQTGDTQNNSNNYALIFFTLIFTLTIFRLKGSKKDA